MALRDRWAAGSTSPRSILVIAAPRLRAGQPAARPSRATSPPRPCSSRSSSCCCRGSCSDRLMPTCGSRPICSRSLWSRSAFRDAGELALRRGSSALAGLAFVLVRTGGTTVSMWLYDRSLRPRARRARPCPARRAAGELRRPAAASSPGRCRGCSICPAWRIVRRHAFSNDQWTMAGAQLLDVRYKPGWPFIRDPTQIVTRQPLPRARSGAPLDLRARRSSRATRSTMSG